MTFKLGDKVRSVLGHEGEIVQLNTDGATAMVKLPGDGRGQGILMLTLARLIWIQAYSPKPEESARPTSRRH